MRKTKEAKMEETIQILADDAAIIDIYQKVLDGRLKRFPHYTWELPNSLYYSKVITQYLFEIILKWSKEDILEHFTEEFIIKFRLRGMKTALFDTFYEILENAYPGQFLPWELKKVPNNFWQSDDNKRKALSWLFEEKMGGDKDYITQHLTIDFFRENDLSGLFRDYFDNSTYKVLDFYYSEAFIPWELTKVPDGYWKKDENLFHALKWLFEEKLGGDATNIKKNLSYELFLKHGLTGLLGKLSTPKKAYEFYYKKTIA